MRTVGDVRADVDRALHDLDKLRLADLPPLIARIEKLAEGHPEVLRDAIKRLRKQIPSSIILPEAREVLDMGIRTLGPRGMGGIWHERLREDPPRPRYEHAIPRVIEQPLQDVYPCELGFTKDIPAGTSEIVTQPQMLFRGELLVIPDEKCTDGDLIEIRVGGHAQAVAGPGRRPLSLYCPAKWADEALMKKATLHMDTATPGHTITLVVDVRKPMHFQAVIRGRGASMR